MAAGVFAVLAPFFLIGNLILAIAVQFIAEGAIAILNGTASVRENTAIAPDLSQTRITMGDWG